MFRNWLVYVLSAAIAMLRLHRGNWHSSIATLRCKVRHVRLRVKNAFCGSSNLDAGIHKLTSLKSHVNRNDNQ